MMKLLAPVENIRFDIEDALEKQTYCMYPLPFIGMDSKLFVFFKESYFWFSNIQTTKDQLQPFVSYTQSRHVKTMQQGCVRSDTSRVKSRWCANIGSEVCARRAMTASFCTSTTWAKCPSATFTQNTTSVATKNASTCT
jgi:hypothetical protein